MIRIRTLTMAKGLAREAAAHKAYWRKHGRGRDYPNTIRASRRGGQPVILSSEYANWERFCG